MLLVLGNEGETNAKEDGNKMETVVTQDYRLSLGLEFRMSRVVIGHVLLQSGCQRCDCHTAHTQPERTSLVSIARRLGSQGRVDMLQNPCQIRTPWA